MGETLTNLGAEKIMINKKSIGHSEIQKIQDLFDKLAKIREQLKTEKKVAAHDWIEKWNTWSVRIMVWSFTPTIGIVIAIAVVTLVLGTDTDRLSWWFSLLFYLSITVMTLAMLSFLFSLAAFFIKLFSRSESQKAKETFDQIQPYIKYGAEISREFSLKILCKAEKSLHQEFSTFNSRSSLVADFLEKLPSALWWIAIFIVFNFSLNAGRFREILTTENSVAFDKFQETLINFAFSSAVNYVSPFFIFNFVMYALVFTLISKSHPIIIAPFTKRRADRYSDYLKLIEQATEFRKDFESKSPSRKHWSSINNQ